MQLNVSGISTVRARDLQAGGPDANQQSPQHLLADAGANPCRHCLQLVPEGKDLLVLSYRPFDAPQPYAETGPIFLHGEHCDRYVSDRLPDWFAHMDPAIIRGYTADDWIAYETGEVVRGVELEDKCRAILADENIAYVHIRSRFNCFQCRVERGVE